MSQNRAEERSQRDVLAAADAFLAADRWRSASMGELAEAARVSRGYLYKHFTTRDGLLLAVLERRGRAFNLRARHRLEHVDCPEVVVQGILLGLDESLRSPFGGPLLGAHDLGAGALRTAAVEEALVQARDLWLPLLERARRAGQLDEAVVPSDLVEWIVMLQLVLCSHHRLLEDGTGVVERWIRTLLITALGGSARPRPIDNGFSVIS